MTFGWPVGLVLLLLLPIGIGLDRLVARRRQRVLAGFVAPLGGASAEAPRRRPTRRFVPPTIVLAGFGILLLGLAYAWRKGALRWV